jgi:hypothetical protein
MMISTRIRFVVLISGLVVFLSACKYTSGRIVDSAGDPIPGVTISFATLHGEILQEYSDFQGQFTYPSSEQPLAMLTIDAEDYAQITERTGKRGTYVLKEDLSPDSDGDLLSDMEELALGTDPSAPDTDRDGLPDALEAKVMTPVAIVAMGVDPLHKDLLVEVDWDSNYPASKLTDLAIKVLKASFRNAPINNPDGKSGINLIVDQGEFGGGSGDDYSFSQSRQDIFYHTMASYDIDSFFGYADLPGRNANITGDFSAFGIGEGFVEAIVWMHELGHNLGLMHGGNDDILCKPNYISVMNYNPFMALSFTYSSGNRPTLYENALDESQGIGFGPVDWNGNHRIDEGLVALDIDGITPINVVQWLLNEINVSALPLDLAQALNPDRCIPFYPASIHRDHNDWAVVEERLDDELLYVMQVMKGEEGVQRAAKSDTEVIVDDFEFPARFIELTNVMRQ